ncbi:MAG: DMT family transporter [Geminicoccaceae bacterium]
MSSFLSERLLGATTGKMDLVALITGIGFALMWSSAFSVVKLALNDAPPFLILTCRFFVSGVIATSLAWMLAQRLPTEPRQWIAILILGLCQNSLYLGLNFKAMTLVPAGLAAIIASSAPLMVAFICRLFLGERLGWIGNVGIAIGFAGVLMIMAERIAGGESAFGIILCIIGAAAFASATLIVRGTDLGSGLLMIVGLQMLVGSISLAPVVYVLEDLDTVRLTSSLALAFTYITLAPGVIATLVWFYLVKRIGATHAAAFHFLNPAFGVIIANAMLGELIGMGDVAGVGIIMISILMVQLSRR